MEAKDCIYRLSFIPVPYKITTEGFYYEVEHLSAALSEARGVEALVLAILQCLYLVFCPLAPSKLKLFSSVPIFHQCHAHYKRILPSTHRNNEGK